MGECGLVFGQHAAVKRDRASSLDEANGGIQVVILQMLAIDFVFPVCAALHPGYHYHSQERENLVVQLDPR